MLGVRSSRDHASTFSIYGPLAEYQNARNDRGRVVRHKFCFQWCEEQGVPWWFAEEMAETGTVFILKQNSILRFPQLRR